MIKLFNPSKIVFSLLVAVAWERIYHKQMIKKLGIGLPSIFYYNDGTGFHLFRKMEDQKALDVFLRRRLASDPAWVRHAMQQHIKEMNYFYSFVNKKLVLDKLGRAEVLDLIQRCLNLVSKVFSFYFLTYHICNNESKRKEFANMMDVVDKARIVSEGYYDRADDFIRRLLRGRVSSRHLQFYNLLTVWEIKKILSSRVVDWQKISKRAGVEYILTHGRIIFGREKVRAYFKSHNYYYPNFLVKENISELKGQPVVKGHVVGKARVVINKQGLSSIKKGEVLITPMTSPDFVPYFKKFAAVVTDYGGYLCHAAIAAREFKVPCIVGTKIATQIFKDGDRVEVDAEKGIVRKLST